MIVSAFTQEQVATMIAKVGPITCDSCQEEVEVEDSLFMAVDETRSTKQEVHMIICCGACLLDMLLESVMLAEAAEAEEVGDAG
jgi:hypothetical protein